MTDDLNSTLGLRAEASTGGAGAEPADPSLVGIGGWLILPAIGFSLGLLVEGGQFIYALSLYSGVARAGYGGIYSLHIAVVASVLVLGIVAAVLFFGKKRVAPSVCVALLIAGPVSSLFMIAAYNAAGAGEFAVELVKELVKQLIGAAIWIPYFLTSLRVRFTFTR
jgi:hypothetical protein